MGDRTPAKPRDTSDAAFIIYRPDTLEGPIVIWPDGEVSGIKAGVIVNNIPRLIAEAHA